MYLGSYLYTHKSIERDDADNLCPPLPSLARGHLFPSLFPKPSIGPSSTLPLPRFIHPLAYAQTTLPIYVSR